MYPSEFDYERAESVEEALELLDEFDGEAELLSGGHSLVPLMKLGLASPDLVVDIGNVEALDGIEIDEETTTIGAVTTYADIVSHEGASQTCPALASAAGQVGDRQVRNRGTIGGNLAHADPASDLPAAALAENATLHVRNLDGSRRVPADDFFIEMYETDVSQGEVLTRVEIPNGTEGTYGAYAKKADPASGYALVGVAASLEVEDGIVAEARVAATGAIDHATRLGRVEEDLTGESIDRDVAERAAQYAAEDIEEYRFMEDLQASPKFRRHLLRVYTERALKESVDPADVKAQAR